MATIVYQTTKAVENPIGDGRHNRAKWRSSLEKSEIPAGFVFAVTDDGDIEDRSKATATVTGEKATQLRTLLLSVATEPLAGSLNPTQAVKQESIEEALSSLGPDAALRALKKLGVTVADLKAAAQAEPGAVQRAVAPGPALEPLG